MYLTLLTTASLYQKLPEAHLQHETRFKSIILDFMNLWNKLQSLEISSSCALKFTAT